MKGTNIKKKKNGYTVKLRNTQLLSLITDHLMNKDSTGRIPYVTQDESFSYFNMISL